MRRIVSLLFLLFVGVPAFAGTSAVTATITDSDSQTWNNGTFQVNFVPQAGVPASSYNVNGATFTQFVTGSMNGSGVITVTLTDLSTITPIGGQWRFTMCPNASASCSAVITSAVVGATPNLSSVLSAGITAPRFSAGQFSFGYLDVEVFPNPAPGSTYFNVTSNAIRLWNGSSWTGAGGGSGAASSSTPAFTVFPATSTACTNAQYSPTGTTLCAWSNTNATSTPDFTATDLTVLWNSIIGSMSGRCGEVDFRVGTYPINSFNTESTGGFTNAYAIGIPGNISSGQYCMWTLKGEAVNSPTGIGSPPAQTSGVVFNITTTATSSIATTLEYAGVWVRPSTSGPTLVMSFIDVRRPNNQRGCSVGIDASQAVNTFFTWVETDYNTAFNSYAFPVAGGGCSGGVASAANTETGVTTSSSGLQLNTWNNVQAVGSNVGLDIQSEHTLLINVSTDNDNICVQYGVNGGPIYHTSTWQNLSVQSCARGLLLGSNMQAGSVLDISGLDFQDANTGAFLPVYHALETNNGRTYGRISYSNILAGAGLVSTASLFDGGGGSNFTVSSQIGTQVNTSNPQPSANLASNATDTFTRANAANLGTNWFEQSFSGVTNGLSIVSNTAQATGAGLAKGAAAYTAANPGNDQFSKATVSSIDSNAQTFASVTTNNTLAGNVRTQYQYYCGGVAAQGSGIQKFVAGAVTILASQTASVGCSSGDTIELRHVGTWLVALHNGQVDTNFSPNPVSDSAILGGVPGLLLVQDTGGGVAMTNWSGGTFTGTQRRILTDFTTANSTAFQSIFSWQLTPGNYTVHCSILFNQTVGAVSDAFGIQAATNAPLNIAAWGWVQTAATTIAYGNLPTLATTTATAIVTFTPSAITTVWQANLDGTMETAATNLFNVMVSQSTGADLMVIKRGSYCTLIPQ